MSINYSPINFAGTDFEPVFMEMLYQNETIAQGKVRLINGIKAQTTITEMNAEVTLQPYTCNEPESDGNINMNDAILSPCKLLSYQEFCPDDLRFSRFSTSMRSGAWENVSEEWVRIVLEQYATRMSRKAEEDFWNGSSLATKTIVAGLSVAGNLTAEEKAYVAASPTTVCDGVVTYLIYNNGNVGNCIDVIGTTIDASNIGTEYATLYASIPAVLLKPSNIGEVRIFAPESHAQLIHLYNLTQTYRDTFFIDAQNQYYFLGVKIDFVPLAENTMIAGLRSDILWGTDSTSDFSYLQIDRVQNNADKRFIKGCFTQGTAVVSQSQKVLYVG